MSLWTVLLKRSVKTKLAGIPIAAKSVIKVEVDRLNVLEKSWSRVRRLAEVVYQSPIA
jgi:hypothetical protein